MSSENNLEVIVENIAKEISVSEYHLEWDDGNKKGEGYLGDFAFVRIKPKKNGNAYNIAIKRAFTNKLIRKDSPIRYLFLNEIYFYKNCLPILNEIQIQYKIPIFNNAPKCYYTSTKDENEYIAMENLKKAGFELFPKEKIMPYTYFEYIFKIYANLHATSVILRETSPKKFQEVTSNFNEIASKLFSNDVFNNMWSRLIKQAGEKLIPGIDDEVIKAYKKYATYGLSLFIKSWGYNGKYPVITHGDCWSNNLMFKYNEKRELLDVKLIDWQLLKVGSPAHDLSYLLYSGGSKDTFDKLEELLQIYYKSFSDVLKKAGLNVEEVYPYSILKKEWKDYSSFGFLISIMIINIKTTNQDDKVDFAELYSSDNKEQLADKWARGTPSEEYDKRIREMLVHVYEIGAF